MSFQPLAHLHLRQMVSGKKLTLLVVLTAMPVVVTALVQIAGGGFADEFSRLAFLHTLFAWVGCLLVTLVYGTSILNTDIDGKTLTYLFTRPVPKWRIIVAKYIATIAFVGFPMLISLFLGWILVGMPGGPLGIIALVLSTLVGVAGWTGVFAAIGIIFHKHPVPVGIIYALLMEVAFTFIPAVVNYATVNYYQRSIFVALFEIPTGAGGLPGRMVGEAPLVVALLVPLVIGAVGVSIAAWLTTNRQFVESQAQAGA